ncbi:SDR family NAD(P)-dependent oxidoreductase [Paenibacillus sp. MMS18-CY102]|uniref:SDR family NAD(P)-dependent oxidoreductase n=1 Tax=Paenibacillus sp. MMS18-CY102 TaxID=2682849 RepID=UPI0013657B89|nr:SDR family NAD(P)-dependent oxidoreductase [Paenibacillus sp. MMS18-CY102]
MEKIDELLCRLLWSQLREAGMFRAERATLSQMKQAAGLHPMYDRWLEETIRLLSEIQFVRMEGDTCVAVQPPADDDIKALWQQWESSKAEWMGDPDMRSQVRLVETTMRELPAIVTGKTPATEVMFPNSSMELLEGVYKNNKVADYFNEVVANIAAAYVANRIKQEPHASIRMLEIGAGTGGTSQMVFNKLEPFKAHIGEYCYTDISRSFLIHAEQQYGPQAPYLAYKLFNAEQQPTDQGIAEGEYDIVIATNVLHATRNMRVTMRNTKALLRKNGMLLVNEMNGNTLFTHLTFGLLEGWWLYEDPELRDQGCPGLSPEAWERVLEAEGYRSIAFPAVQAHGLGQQIIVAESDGMIRRQQAVGNSEPKRVKAAPTPSSRSEEEAQSPKLQPSSAGSDELLRERALVQVKKLVGETFRIPADQINGSAPLEEYGLDSILVVQLTNAFRKVFTGVTSTLFFECRTTLALVEHFMRTQREQLAAFAGVSASAAAPELPDAAAAGQEASAKAPSPITPKGGLKAGKFGRAVSPKPEANPRRTETHRRGEQAAQLQESTPWEGVAIIGLAGRYPGAPDVASFWDNLKAGKSGIGEIPADRWDWRDYFDPKKGKRGAMYSKWGGFIADADKFDPLFFQISPAEAERMDPQERVFLETVYASIEDAGYTPGTLATTRKIGVFAGVMNGNYATGPLYYSIANRISYLFNFQGPSMAIDTACSSSLTAIHLAMESLRSGTCETAIAGGVNLIVDPVHYLKLSEVTMLSAGDQCRSFGAGADGFVDAEGAGAAVLKPLARAIEDGDHIYGILQGSMLNAGGRTHGYSVPNPVAQSELIADALARSGVHPREVSYVEAHGTGTALGDPIEIAGLASAFRRQTGDTGFCAIGSVKSNIGHCESAAGIAGITKVLLQMKHGLLAPSLHADETNPEIEFGQTPFYLQRELAEWNRPQVSLDGSPAKARPRIAGISSFGAGGANAHVVVEEFVASGNDQSAYAIDAGNPAIIVLSAKRQEQLMARVQRLMAFIQSGQLVDGQLANAAYTLQVGREAMEERLAVIATSVQDLYRKLQQFADGEKSIEGVYSGQAKKSADTVSLLSADEELQEAVAKWLQRKKYAKLLDLWVKGLTFDWNSLYENGTPNRISLPAYPFARERYWLERKDAAYEPGSQNKPAPAMLHPLVHRNTSDLTEQRFTSEFSGTEFFIADHAVNGSPMMSGAACLELARTALELSIGNPLHGADEAAGGDEMAGRTLHPVLRNVMWDRPIVANSPTTTVHIAITAEDEGTLAFDIYGSHANEEAAALRELDHSAEEMVYCRGEASFEAGIAPAIQLPEWQARCSTRAITGEEVYAAYASMGIVYGPAHQAIRMLWTGDGCALAELELPHVQAAGNEAFVIHPGMLDSALQAALGLVIGAEGEQKAAVPFAVDTVGIYAPCDSRMWAVVSRIEANGKQLLSRYDIDLCDREGRVCVRLRGIMARETGSGLAGQLGLLLLQPKWDRKPEPLVELADSHDIGERIIVLVDPQERVVSHVAAALPGARCISLQSHASDVAGRFGSYAERLLAELQHILKEKKRRKAAIQTVIFADGESEALAGLNGLVGTIRLEEPSIAAQLLIVQATNGTCPSEPKIVQALEQLVHMPEASCVRLDGEGLAVAGWEAAMDGSEQAVPWKDEGIYLITGGAGALGMLFAKEIAKHAARATIVLAGRSLKGKLDQAWIQELEAAGITIVYKQADVGVRSEVERLLADIDREYGPVCGIIHSAGALRDNYVLRKTAEEMREVFAPKVSGTVALDEASALLELDFFICFSSGAALGNVGQADYAAANAFMDNYARYRAGMVKKGLRHGRTLSINWPLWQEGAMQLDEETAKLMRTHTGMAAMPSAMGMDAFYRIMASDATHSMAMYGDTERLRQTFVGPASPPAKEPRVDAPLAAAPQPSMALDLEPSFLDRVAAYIAGQLATVLKLPLDRLNLDTELEAYGIESITIIKLTNYLEQSFGTLPKTLFFEYRTVRTLAEYFASEHRGRLMELLNEPVRMQAGSDAQLGVASTEAANSTANAADRAASANGFDYSRSKRRALAGGSRRGRYTPSAGPASSAASAAGHSDQDIAIIGIACRFPGAADTQQFWDNLKAGKDCITEIPADRWDHSQYFDPVKGKPHKTYTKWGGFIDGVDRFDPLFFHISPREAEAMDPQERLFLQCVHETLEDAGYTRETLAGKGRGTGGTETSVGVYVGVMYEEYQLYGAQETMCGRPMALSGNPSSVANRVSYYFNFNGPSMAVDTMCSSSLTAIHLASQSLRLQECDVAIAGGVNVSIHPNKYLQLGQGKFASSIGRCVSFGEGGDGYVPGEGVGAVLLKPLHKAQADGDLIYGVIKGSSINHGGKTNGYTVPNPGAQSAVIERALRHSGIDPRTISYLEAHGTGTSLGDPIEIAGLSKAFRQWTDETGFCSIGSVKSNIGHCESAAGIAGLIKVLLQLKHGELVPSLHAEKLNPNIDFGATPFVVQREGTSWERPIVERNGVSREVPRRAGISAFGAGGSNAHLVVEEYAADQQAVAQSPTGPAVVLLSAKNDERLQERASRLLATIRRGAISPSQLHDVAYTLQIGREPMESRLALLVTTMAELEAKLASIEAGEPYVADVYRGQLDQNNGLLADDEDMRVTIEAWITKRKFAKVMELWTRGLQVDWSKLYSGGAVPRRISLPGYPFAQERCWAPTLSNYPILSETGMASAPVSRGSGNRDGEEAFVMAHKRWEPCGVSRKSDAVDGVVAILSTDRTLALAEQLASMLQTAHIVVASGFDASSVLGGMDWQQYGGCIDLVGCDPGEPDDIAGLAWVQQLIDNGHKRGMKLLGVTHGLERFENQGEIRLSGAARAGLYRMLGREYKHVTASHLDADCALQGRALAAQIAQEFASDSDDAEACYRAGVRYRTYLDAEPAGLMDPIQVNASAAFPPSHVLLVTGGTRGLGYAAARFFAEHRGVKKVVLTGREQLPDRSDWAWHEAQQPDSPIAAKIRAIRALEGLGAEVQVLSLPLDNREEVRRKLQQIRQSLGPIGGLIHCAGLTDKENPAFIRKPEQSIRKVMEPKVAGLQVLLGELTEHEHEHELRFAVLYSSVSAIIPSLAVGQSDYAMANSYMDYVAEAMQDRLPIISIQWPNWKESGLGEISGGAYAQTGLLGLTDNEGLALLGRIIDGERPAVVMPARIQQASWEPKRLLQAGRSQQAVHERLGSAAVAAGAAGMPGILSASQKTTASRQRAGTGTPVERVGQWLTELLAEQLKLDAARLQWDKPFQDYGMDSILLAQVVTRLDKAVGEAVDPGAMLEHSTIRAFAHYLIEAYPKAMNAIVMKGEPVEAHEPVEFLEAAVQQPVKEWPADEELLGSMQVPLQTAAGLAPFSVSKAERNQASARIAIVGLSCHFPDAPDAASFWSNLANSKDSIREIPVERWKGRGENGAFLEGIENFDAGYFKVTESLAVQMDPLQRQWLEVSAEALADAGYSKSDLWGKQVGVFVGARTGAFARKLRGSKSDTIIGTAQNFIGAHLSHIYNFKGPNMVVDTACSSTLTAIHLAARSILSGECEAALAGGVDILDESVYEALDAAKVMSPSGRCKTFAADADGIGVGEGCGVLLLKRLEDAIASGDKIYGVIDGSAVNNDGNTMGVTTPNPDAQQELIEQAITSAGVGPETIGYVETHGTGTLIGDPLELKGLTRIFSRYVSDKQICGVGSVKTNIGHLLSAAGAASVIKVLLAIIHEQLPPTLNCDVPNPRFKFEESPLFPVKQLMDWKPKQGILRAGISSFGLGGNNAHILLSNEGVPEALKATLQSKLPMPAYNKQRYWPEPQKETANEAAWQGEETADAAFMSYFDSVKVQWK